MIFLQVNKENKEKIAQLEHNIAQKNAAKNQAQQATNESSMSNGKRRLTRQMEQSKTQYIKRERARNTMAKVFSLMGIVFLLGGIGLLIVGIIDNKLYGYVAGGALIGIGVIQFVIVGIIICKSKTDYKNTAANIRRLSRVTPVN